MFPVRTITLIIFLALCPVISHGSKRVHLETYGETVSLESEGGRASSLSVKAIYAAKPELRWFPRPYIGGAWDRYAPNSGKVQRFSPLAGVELRPLGSWRLFAEYRQVFESPRSGYRRSDPRVGVIGGQWWDLPLGKNFSLFSDSYLDLIAIPRISDNPSLTAFSKFGPRARLEKGIYLDLYGEAYARESDDTNLGRRALELRSGLRSVYAFGEDGSWCASAALFRRFHTFRDAPEAEWRLLFALGGSL